MTKYAFSDYSIGWLKGSRFTDEEIDMLQSILNMIEYRRKKGETRVKLPKDVTERVAAMAYLLDSITDAEGKPICLEDNGLIDIPDEARQYFEDDLEMEHLEMTLSRFRKMKFARRYSYPRRRGSAHENEKFGGL